MDQLYHAPRSPEEASLLGPGNWFTPSEAAHWLGISLDHERCYRPEQIAITNAAETSFIVEEARFAGAFGEVTLADERTAKRRRFYHRPAGPGFKKGCRVALRVIGVLLLCLMASACVEKDQPVLKVREIHYWSMPPKGRMIPAPRSVTCGPHDEVIVLDRGGRVIVFSENGQILRKWNMPDARIGNPEGACVFLDGRIAVADTHYARVVFFNQEGKVVGMLGSEGTGPVPVPLSGLRDAGSAREFLRRRVRRKRPRAEVLGRRQIPAANRQGGERARGSSSGPAASCGATGRSTWPTRSTTASRSSPTRANICRSSGSPSRGVTLGFPYCAGPRPAERPVRDRVYDGPRLAV